MKPTATVVLLVAGFLAGIAVSGGWTWANPTGLAALSLDEPRVFFCPQDPCAQQLAAVFENAQTRIDIAVYSFTLDELSDALLAAHKRGVHVRVLIDDLQAANDASKDERLEDAGISLRRVRLNRGYMHHKFAVIDSQITVTGSYNYSQNASRFNYENLLFLHDEALSAQYQSEFDSIWNAFK